MSWQLKQSSPAINSFFDGGEFCPRKQFGPDQDVQNVSSDLDPTSLTL